MRFILTLLIIVTWSTASSAEDISHNDSCFREMAKKLFNHTHLEILDHVKFFDGKLTQGHMNLGDTDFYDKNSIYIGVANHKKEGPHHYYMVSGNQRFDGRALFQKVKIKTFKEGNSIQFNSLMALCLKSQVRKTCPNWCKTALKHFASPVA